jgi:outer membrane receptor protein involved in Fe transport
MNLWGNPLNWHLVGNYTDERTNTVLGIKFDGAGIYGGSGFVNPLSGLTSPKLRFNISATYDLEPYEITVQSRFIGSARISNTYVTGVDIDHNWIPPVAYLDLRGSYRWSDRIQLYFAVDNTLNTPPAIGTGSQGGLGQIYDALGRSFRVGVRFDD